MFAWPNSPLLLHHVRPLRLGQTRTLVTTGCRLDHAIGGGNQTRGVGARSARRRRILSGRPLRLRRILRRHALCLRGIRAPGTLSRRPGRGRIALCLRRGILCRVAFRAAGLSNGAVRLRTVRHGSVSALTTTAASAGVRDRAAFLVSTRHRGWEIAPGEVAVTIARIAALGRVAVPVAPIPFAAATARPTSMIGPGSQ